MTHGIFKKAAELLKQYMFSMNSLLQNRKTFGKLPRSDSRAHVYFAYVLWSLSMFYWEIYRRNDSVVLGFCHYFHHFLSTQKTEKSLEALRQLLHLHELSRFVMGKESNYGKRSRSRRCSHFKRRRLSSADAIILLESQQP